ncbi:hypothetical protein [Klebsiella quasipneumoniae]|uniref:hypothetical protein n=1 Tax=Klebsiella quasipneumoniae TaxID=1463165 RepID=UPI0021D135F5|nr:hypothetical protein [Klebsiella quasipneumoniae]MCU6521986.1 hypothetical protein [Klebsiella quasipneumoniae]
MTDAELAQTKELAFWMTERVFMNPISAKFLNEDWRKAFPDEVAVAERMKALVEALELKEQLRANWFQMAQKLGEDLDAAEKRIAELESRTVTVKLPDEVDVLLNHLEDVLPFEVFQLIDAHKWNAVSRLSASGIKVETE